MEQQHPTIPMQPVDSSQIAAIGHDLASRTLAVQFKGSGTTYHYDDVGVETFASFLKAESKGKFFGSHVKGKFGYRKIGALAKK